MSWGNILIWWEIHQSREKTIIRYNTTGKNVHVKSVLTGNEGFLFRHNLLFVTFTKIIRHGLTGHLYSDKCVRESSQTTHQTYKVLLESNKNSSLKHRNLLNSQPKTYFRNRSTYLNFTTTRYNKPRQREVCWKDVVKT